MPRLQPQCKHCKGNNVTVDAIAQWNVKRQCWELIGSLNSGYCMDCNEVLKPRDWEMVEMPRGKNWSPIQHDKQGRPTWIKQPGDKFDVTGVDRKGKRFAMRYDSWFQAKNINLYSGSRWLVRNNRRYLISRVTN